MVDSNNSWLLQQQSACQLPNFSCMTATFEPANQGCLPACAYPSTGIFSSRAALLEFTAPAISGWNLQEGNGTEGYCLFPPVRFQSLFPRESPFCKDNQAVPHYGLSTTAIPGTTPCSSGKRYLIFDQSGDNTRLIYNSLGATDQNAATAAAEHVYDCHINRETYATKVDEFDSLKPILHEECDENHLSGEESEMHEDTEEINALLYSDDDDEDYDEDEEVMSTGHSPNLLKRSFENLEKDKEITDEVVGSGGPYKKHKLLQGRCKKALPLQKDSAVDVNGFCGYHSDAESNFVVIETKEEEDVNSVSGEKLSKKTKIRETLRLLKSIVPGAEGQDTLTIIDEAIGYLKSLKDRATTFGVNCE